MRYTLFALLLLALTADSARAQEANDVFDERPSLSVALVGGGLSPTGELPDGSRFETGGTIGGALTVWTNRLVGVRGTALRTRTPVAAPADAGLAGQEPTVWLYSADLLVRLPVESAHGWGWYPYLAGGLGLKHYDFDASEDYRKKHNDFAGSLGGGLEYRFGRWGIQTEARGFLSKFDRGGYDDTQRDLVYTAGITVHF